MSVWESEWGEWDKKKVVSEKSKAGESYKPLSNGELFCKERKMFDTLPNEKKTEKHPI